MTTRPRPLLITMGDAAGIGPEIIAKAFCTAPQETAGCIVVGDIATMRRATALAAAHFGKSALPVAWLGSLDAWEAVPARCMGVVQQCALPLPPAYGKVSALSGQAAADCIVWAARATLAGHASAMVTAPIHKEALFAAGGWVSCFPGHTEMLQAEAARFLDKPVNQVPVRMMLANPELKTILVSIHLSLKDAIAAVTFENVLQTLRIAHRSLALSLQRPPRIAVAGLNPHAGEGGLFGTEEQTVIAPAIAAALGEGIDVHGPIAPDTVFMRARHSPEQSGEFDVVVAMYHDQGLIPLKYLGMEQGVNLTLGLPLVRTSPDHGTAFDIAGSAKADASSLLAAIRMARERPTQAQAM